MHAVNAVSQFVRYVFLDFRLSQINIVLRLPCHMKQTSYSDNTEKFFVVVPSNYIDKTILPYGSNHSRTAVHTTR